MSETAQAILEQIIDSKLAQASPLQRTWYTPETLRDLYQRDLRADIERVLSDELAKKFHHYCPVPGASDDDFKNRWLELPGLGRAIIGIRFWNLDLGRPFVAVTFSETLLQPGTDIGALKSAVAEVYGLFQPKHLRFFFPGHWRGDISTWREAHWEKRYLAAPLREMCALPKPRNLGRLRLRQAADMTFYAAYADLYERRFAAFPLLREYTRTETEEAMAEYLQEGTLFEVEVDGAWSGIICVTRHVEQGLKGFLVVEMLLEPHLSGQGLGVAAQYRLAHALNAEEDDVLFGTIDARNTATIKTARRSGRADVGGFLWLPI